MQTSAIRDEVRERARDFAWDQWSQLGLLARTGRRDAWAMDPEALLLFTFEVGRDDPRLFDEVLDWLAVNERLVSVQRLRNLARDDADRAQLAAVLEWLAQRGSRSRSPARWRPPDRRPPSPDDDPAPQPAERLFRDSGAPIPQPDQAFLAHGWLKPPSGPELRSGPPDMTAPVSFALRLRQLLGLGARAEVVRILLGTDAPRVNAAVVARAAAYSKRNVHEALGGLRAAGVVDVVEVGSQLRYHAPRERWAELFDVPPSAIPYHRDWPELLYALRRIIRWLCEPRVEGLSDYMRASEARTLIEEIGPDLRYAGVRVLDYPGQGAEYWDDFVASVREALRALE
jgi:hypothetical protein